MNWFEKLTGFEEENKTQVQSNIEIKGQTLTSKSNGKSYTIGHLEIPKLKELKERISIDEYKDHQLEIQELVGDIQVVHQNPKNKGAIFQVASQFNLLEMVSPDISPELGVTIYQNDLTQGPACAIACGAATIYRNYFVPVNNEIGQSRYHQINCLEDLTFSFKNTEPLWDVKNGYALPFKGGLNHITNHLSHCTESEYLQIKDQLKVGIQWDTEVTLGQSNHLVTQVFSSALPIAYTLTLSREWEAFAKLILEGTYEATLYAALENYNKTGNPNVYLTLVGGGAFGNPIQWIIEAIQKALLQFKHTPLKVYMVSYGRSSIFVQDLINSVNHSFQS